MKRFASNVVIFPACGGSSVWCGGSFGKVVMKPFFRVFSSTSVTNEIERKFIFNDAILDYCSLNATSKREIFMRDVYFDNSTYCLTTRDMWLRQRNDKLELKWPMMHAPKEGTADLKSPETLVGLDFYQESTDTSKIADVLHTIPNMVVKFPSMPGTMDENIQALATAGIQPFGTVLTHRVRYNLSMQLPLDLVRAEVKAFTSADNKINMFVDIDTVKYVLPHQVDGNNTLSTTSEGSDARSTYQIGEIEFDFISNGTTESVSSMDAAGKASNAAIMQHVFRVIGIEPAPVRGKVLEYLVRFRPEHFEALRKSGQLASKGL